MSEERVIRINKVLRELNISLERAVDYLKDKGIAIESNPNTKISNEVYDVLCGQFAGDRGKKEASKEVSEEKRKEKEALRIERDREAEDKRKQEEELQRQQQEVIKARAVISGPVQVGKIDLNPSKPTPSPVAEEKVSATKPEVAEEKPAAKISSPEKSLSDKKEEKIVAEVSKPVVENTTPKTEVKKEDKTTVVEPKVKEVVKTEEAPAEDAIATQYQKLSGAKLTGQTIDLSQFDKPKKKKKILKLRLINRVLQELKGLILTKVNVKELLLNQVLVLQMLRQHQEYQVHQIQIR